MVLVAALAAPAGASAPGSPGGRAAAPGAHLLAQAPGSAPTATTAPPIPLPKAWALVDVGTGAVIDGGNDRVPLPPASLTKVITALTAVATIPPDAAVPVSARAEAAPADKLFIKQGQVWTFDEMLHALLISSANDAAVALAERGGGTVEGFQAKFDATAAGLGMADHPVLNDPAGLDGPDGVEGGNLVSARDLAIASRALLATPVLAAIVATPVYYFDGPDGIHHRLTNHNKLFLTSYPGAIGVKTGYTERAGACLIAAARRDGRTMLAVVMNGAYPNTTAEHLLDEGFSTPVSAEPAADRLPEVHPAVPAQANAVAAPTARHGAGAPAARGDAASAAAPRPSRAGAPGRTSHVAWPLVGLLTVLASAVAAVVLLRARAVRRRGRRLHRRREAAGDGLPGHPAAGPPGPSLSPRRRPVDAGPLR